jgi:hypothetical protein
VSDGAKLWGREKSSSLGQTTPFVDDGFGWVERVKETQEADLKLGHYTGWD